MDLEIGNFLYLKYWDLDYLYCLYYDYYNWCDWDYLLNYDYYMLNGYFEYFDYYLLILFEHMFWDVEMLMDYIDLYLYYLNSHWYRE